jgi:rhodanese-related sulfurtransferase
MQIISFLKNIFSANATTSAEPTDGPQNRHLSGKAFKAELEATPGAVLLDVRTAGEVKGGTLPGALHVDFLSLNFTQKVAQLNKETTYFVFCRSGSRSGQACKMMHKMGFDVRNLSGGIGAFPN